jgi:hypothetical protein
MPRPPSGNPHWQAVVVKLPPDLLAEVQRYTRLHGGTISQTLRDGLVAHLQPAVAPAPGAAGNTGNTGNTGVARPESGPALLEVLTLLTQVLEALSLVAEQLQQVCQGAGSAQEYNRNTPTTPRRYNGNTRRQHAAPAQVVSELDVTAYGLDPATRALRPLCPRGHGYADTGLSLFRVLRNPKGQQTYVCLACDAEKAKDRRAAKKQAVAE